jgi:hypothetical protein
MRALALLSAPSANPNCMTIGVEDGAGQVYRVVHTSGLYETVRIFESARGRAPVGARIQPGGQPRQRGVAIDQPQQAPARRIEVRVVEHGVLPGLGPDQDRLFVKVKFGHGRSCSWRRRSLAGLMLRCNKKSRSTPRTGMPARRERARRCRLTNRCVCDST